MKFNKALPIVYPFTAYYYGYIADTGENPKLQVNLFSHDTAHAIVDVDVTVDLREVRQVSNDTLFVGTIYINRDGNNLLPGNYRILLTLQLPYTTVDLLYAPIELVDYGSPFQVSYLNRQNLTEDEFRSYMKDLVDPGIKKGMDIIFGTDTNSLVCTPGVAFSKGGTKIVMDEPTRLPFFLRRTYDYPRTDLICIFYDESRQDAKGTAMEPEFRIIEGVGVNSSEFEPPLLPDNYIPLAYVTVKEDSEIIDGTTATISQIRPFFNGRPFFNIQANEIGNGIRDTFTFNIEYIRNTTEVYVDGVRQYIHEDYSEEVSTSGFGTIKFIGEVPGEGQSVTLSGQTLLTPYLDSDRTSYITPRPVVDYPYSHPTEGLVARYIGNDYSLGEAVWNCYELYQASMQATMAERPIYSYNNGQGRCVYFKHTDRLRSEGDVFAQKNIAIVLNMNLKDSPHSSMRSRVLTMDTLFIDVVNNEDQTDFILNMNGDDVLILNVPSGYIDLNPSILSLNIFDDEISLRYNNGVVRRITDTSVIEGLLSDNMSYLGLGRPYLEDDDIEIPAFNYSLSALYVYNRKIDTPDIALFK